MKIYQKFLAKLYIKKFILLFFALELFFTGIDLMKNLKLVPSSANLQILYGVNKAMEFISYTLPLSLIFALLMAMLQIIKSNELVTLYALGVSKKEISRPFVWISLLLTLLYLALNTSSGFIQAHENASNIKKRGTLSNISSSIFLKAKDTYVYIDTLHPYEKRGENLKVFITKEGDLKEVLEAKSGYFQKDHWELQEIKAYQKPPLNGTSETKLIIKTYPHKKILYGFTPRIIDTLFKSNTRLTIQDSIRAMRLFKHQELKTNKVRANLYTITIFSFFAPIMVYAIFFLLPAHQRDANLTFVSTLVVFASLTLWGIMFTMTKIANNGSISPELGILLPMTFLLFGSLYIGRKYQN